MSEVCSANKQFVQLRTGLSLAFELAIYSYLSDLTSWTSLVFNSFHSSAVSRICQKRKEVTACNKDQASVLSKENFGILAAPLCYSKSNNTYSSGVEYVLLIHLLDFVHTPIIEKKKKFLFGCFGCLLACFILFGFRYCCCCCCCCCIVLLN